MSEHESRIEPDQLKQQCREAVDQLIARNGWQLLDPEDFAQRTLSNFRAGVGADPSRAAIYTYSLALYFACSGAEGPERQNIGYTELFHFLYDIAFRRYREVADEVTQQALEAIFTAFERCREPGAFIAFALQHLMDAARRLRRQADRQPQSLSAPIGTEQTTLGELLPDNRQLEAAENALAEERRVRLRVCATAFLQQRPRATLQFDVLWMKYIDGLDDATISRRLGKPITSIYVLRSRAIKALQSDADWHALASEWGVVPYSPQ